MCGQRIIFRAAVREIASISIAKQLVAVPKTIGFTFEVTMKPLD
jgi:hypothetical protein